MFCSNCGASVSGLLDAGPAKCLACGQLVGTPMSMDDRNAGGLPGAFGGFPGAPPPATASPFGPSWSAPQVPPAPRTPSPRARDLIFGYQGSQGVKLWIGGAFMLAGLIFGTIFCWGMPSDLAIALMGRTVSGTVINTEIQTSVSVNHRHPLLIRYSYRIGGARHEGSSSTLSWRAGALEPGASIQVETIAAMPSFSRAAGTTCSAFGYTPIFVLIFPLVGAILFFSTVRENRREIRAFTYGTETSARVVFQGPDTTTKVNGRHPFKIDWEFQVGGGSYRGTISHMNRSALDGLVEGGERITVLYDPGNPKINTIYVG